MREVPWGLCNSIVTNLHPDLLQLTVYAEADDPIVFSYPRARVRRGLASNMLLRSGRAIRANYPMKLKKQQHGGMVSTFTSGSNRGHQAHVRNVPTNPRETRNNQWRRMQLLRTKKQRQSRLNIHRLLRT